VLSGVVLALVPGLPVVELAPELVLLLVLPPIIYASAMAMSWRELRFNLRSISLSALGCVLFATVAVPGSPLADGARMARGLRIVSMPTPTTRASSHTDITRGIHFLDGTKS